MTRPPLAPADWKPGDEPPRLRWMLLLLLVGGMFLAIGLTSTRVRGLFFVVAAATAALATLVALIPRRFYEWDPDSDEAVADYYQNTRLGRSTTRFWELWHERGWWWKTYAIIIGTTLLGVAIATLLK